MDKDTESPHLQRLRSLTESVLPKRPLIVVSNRGPVEHHAAPDGSMQARRGSGGVVTALNSLTRMVEFTWVASAMGEGDRKIAEEHQGSKIRSPLPGHRASVRYITTPRRVYHKYYNVLCNPLLWFLQHYMWNSPYNPHVDKNVHDAWIEGYVPVNQAFSDAVIKEALLSGAPPLVMTHDYHLYLVPGMIREKLPEAVIQHFNHIPWPAPRYWMLLPGYMRTHICSSLLSANIVGFQSRSDVRSFLDACEEFVPECQVDHNKQTISVGLHTCRVKAYPISIDVDEISRIATSNRAQETETKLRSEIKEQAIVRVDRAEPSKNIIRGFRAFNLLLSRYPELHGKVTFLAFLVPSRTHIRQYQRYMEEIQRVIDDINESFGKPEWQPIRTFLENNYTQAVAGMKIYDVLLVNAVIDGMNLVAKEGPIVNTKNGVLVLSETIGAHYQLRHSALSVAPADIEGTMQAMYQALTMNHEERKERSDKLVESISHEDISDWICKQIEDLQDLL